MFKNIIVLAVLLGSYNAYAYDYDQECSHINKYGIVKSGYKLLNICREGYSIGYNEKTKSPTWVAENLTKVSLDGVDLERTNNFRADPWVPENYSANDGDYIGSGFDRGHMAPADDFRGNEQEMSDSFYYSNVVPQNSILNRTTWGMIEKNVRYLAKEYGNVLVVTGPIYYKGKTLGYAGTVPVPTHIFKAVYIPKINQAVAFIMPNMSVNADQIMNSRSTINNLNEITGLNIFPKVGQDVKNVIPEDLYFFDK